MIGIDSETTIETVGDSIAAHPTLAEGVKEAALVALGRPIHFPPAREESRRLMRATRFLMPTLRDAPADAQAISHQLLVRAGFVRQIGAGLCTRTCRSAGACTAGSSRSSARRWTRSAGRRC